MKLLPPAYEEQRELLRRELRRSLVPKWIDAMADEAKETIAASPPGTSPLAKKVLSQIQQRATTPRQHSRPTAEPVNPDEAKQRRRASRRGA